jgi:hypothetical protein
MKMNSIVEADKKLNFADFLVSRGDSETYSSAAFKHVMNAATIVLKILTDLDDNSLNSPQLVAKTLKRFNEPKAADFSKFYIGLLKLTGKPKIPVADVEVLIKQTRDFMQWVQEHRVDTDVKPY